MACPEIVKVSPNLDYLKKNLELYLTKGSDGSGMVVSCSLSHAKRATDIDNGAKHVKSDAPKKKHPVALNSVAQTIAENSSRSTYCVGSKTI